MPAAATVLGVPRKITAVLTGFAFLESPRWHEGRIWFSDFYTYRVVSAAGDGSDLRVEAEVPEQPSGLGWLPDGRLLVVSMRNRQLLRREHDGALVVHAELGDHVGGFPNDMVVDHLGRAFVGNFGIDFRTQSRFEPANLLRVDPDGTITEVARDLWFPNGSVITDGGTLVVGETFGNRISAFDISPDGSLANRRIWAKFAELPNDRELPALRRQRVVAADGCCLDAEGALWLGDADGGPLRRVREGGEIVEEINAGTGVYACMLGGDDGRTLYLCTAPDYREEFVRDRRDAALLCVRVEVPHAGLP
ncbi:MAG: SMP-30/gluconolactonase/LRE family protein [Acidimicrobiaceae bacterium]|nr:SMP-30/gluconolactonase/LRE family protein [Acidimicrobiaceae bacterium]